MAYPDNPIDWDAELANASNTTKALLLYEFYHKEGDNTSLLMVGKQLKTRDLKAFQVYWSRHQTF